MSALLLPGAGEHALDTHPLSAARRGRGSARLVERPTPPLPLGARLEVEIEQATLAGSNYTHAMALAVSLAHSEWSAGLVSTSEANAALASIGSSVRLG